MEFDKDLELTVTITADYRKGSAPYFDRIFGNWLPGDDDLLDYDVTIALPIEVLTKALKCAKNGQASVSIKSLLTKDQITNVEEDISYEASL